MKAIFKNNLSFLLPYLLFLLFGAILILVNAKAQTHLLFNSFHNPAFDVLNTYTTYLGDGFTAALFIIMMLGVKYRYFIVLWYSLCNILSIVNKESKFIFENRYNNWHIKDFKDFYGFV